jgi:hypothetical protein
MGENSSNLVTLRAVQGRLGFVQPSFEACRSMHYVSNDLRRYCPSPRGPSGTGPPFRWPDFGATPGAGCRGTGGSSGGADPEDLEAVMLVSFGLNLGTKPIYVPMTGISLQVLRFHVE